MSIARLRALTQPLHDHVDAAFGGFRLDDRVSYGRFLRAHALALPAAETALATVDGVPAWRPRAPLLAADLADLGESGPTPIAFDLPTGQGAAWGALYVVEGSRLGGVMLARGIGAGLPSRYLGAAHLPGEWRDLRLAFDERSASGGAGWMDEASAGAHATFALYEEAARLV